MIRTIASAGQTISAICVLCKPKECILAALLARPPGARGPIQIEVRKLERVAAVRPLLSILVRLLPRVPASLVKRMRVEIMVATHMGRGTTPRT